MIHVPIWWFIVVILLIVSIFLWISSAIYLNSYQDPNYDYIGDVTTVTISKLGKLGDMGNQLFQVATAIHAIEQMDDSSSVKLVLPNRTKELPLYQLFDIDGVTYDDITHDKNFHEHSVYSSINIPNDGHIYSIDGYRQSYLYVWDSRDIIRQRLKIKDNILQKVKDKLPEKFIAIHIRRGDTVNLISSSIIPLRGLGICDMNYYIEALKTIEEDLPVIICTDSPNSVDLTLFHKSCSFSPIIDDVKGKFSDFCVLYLASHIIISNSTYSWWASFLSDAPTIAPINWWENGVVPKSLKLNYANMYCPEWKTLNRYTGKEQKYDKTDEWKVSALMRSLLLINNRMK